MKIKNAAALISAIYLSLSVSAAFAFDSKDILSPASGSWCNQQALVLDTSDESDLYYSLSGSDPLASGFAYDGPVVIDATGYVTVNITAVSKQGVRTDYTVNYTVHSPDNSRFNEEEALFLQGINSNPIIKLYSGTKFNIPASFQYNIGNENNNFHSGQELYTNKNSLLDRYIPCTVTNGVNYWHFVLHTVPVTTSPLLTRTVPFEFTDWNTFTFTGEKLIYQIDDNYWTGDKVSLYLDRSVPHVIRWQSMDYTEGNPVMQYIIPEKPELSMVNLSDNSIEFSLDSDDTDFAIKPSISQMTCIPRGLYKKINLDLIEGDTLDAVLDADIYYDNVYQGKLSSGFSIDKKAPASPVIASSSRKGIARAKVVLNITAEENSLIYYAISNPLLSDTGFEDVSPETLDAIQADNFVLYKGGDIYLRSDSEKASFYKVKSFCIDLNGNYSTMAEYRVVVDEFNYYLAPEGTPSITQKNATSTPDGSYSNPFTTFDQALEAINGTSNAKLHVYGNIPVENGVKEITSSCKISGTNCRIIVKPNSSFYINGASVSLNNVIIEKKNGSSAKGSASLFKVNAGSLNVSGCEVMGNFTGDALLIEGEGSFIQIKDTGLSLQTTGYGCIISAVQGIISINECRLTCVSETSVGLSLGTSKLSLTSSSIQVLGQVGRCVELYSSEGIVTGNSFTAKLSGSAQNLKPFHADSNSKISEYSNNDETGF